MTANLEHIVAEGVAALGLELVECRCQSGGLLSLRIERNDGAATSLEDCERATRHLQNLLATEEADYSRLEVSSPGMDRPLRGLADWQRFMGRDACVRLHTARMIGAQKRREVFGRIAAVAPASAGFEFDLECVAERLHAKSEEVETARLALPWEMEAMVTKTQRTRKAA